MKAPICEICARSDILCASCQEKVEKGKINRVDVPISKLLYRLESKDMIYDTGYERSIIVDDCVFLVASGNIASLIGKGGRIVRLISNQINKKVRVVSKGDIKTVARDLVYPAKLRGVNVVFTPKGQVYNIIVPKHERVKIGLNERVLQRVASKLTDKDVKLVFD